MPPPSPRPDSYPVARALFAYAALTGAVAFAVRDVSLWFGAPFGIKAVAAGLDANGFAWLSKVAGRLELSGAEFSLAMLYLLCVSIAYGLAQIGAAWFDRSALRRVRRPLSPAASALLARPPAWAADKGGVERHFDQGREMVFAPLRLGLWLFPVLGFLGTIIGISAAIEKLPSAMNKQGDALKDVVGELHFAFDTTFFGLVAAIALMLVVVPLTVMWERNSVLSASSACPPCPAPDADL